ncbi:hypothetical protein ES703_77943 [subsurface metagenome]
MFVNSLLKSKYFWAVIAGLVLIFWLARWDASKAWKVIKLLGKLAINLFALFLGLFGLQFKKILDGVEA